MFDSELCQGITKAGDRCMSRASVLQFCRKHCRKTEEKVRCLGIIRLGLRCENSAQRGLQYCKRHDPKYIDPSKLCQCTPCANRAETRSKYCLKHLYLKYADSPDFEKWNSQFNFKYTPSNTIIEALNYFGLQGNINYTDIKKKYRELALKHHPDKGGDTIIFQKIQNYYALLGEKYK